MFLRPKNDRNIDFYKIQSASLRNKDKQSNNKLINRIRAMKRQEMDESFVQIMLQVLFPYLVAGIGMVGAGTVLNHVKQWNVFVHVSEVVILVPALLGLKGNLEMTLAARLSTQANLGTMDIPRECLRLLAGNLTLTLCQSLVVGFLAAALAVCFAWLQRGYIELPHASLIIASSMTTAFMACIVLDALMFGVVVLSRRAGINPDNVATPVAGSLGDLTAILFLATTSNIFYRHMATVWFSPLVILLLGASLPLWWRLTSNNEYVKQVLSSGWSPIVGAMAISTFGGVVLDGTLLHYEGLARFQPVINGIGGNLVAIQASRMSTSLHKIGPLGTDLSSSYKDFEFWKGSFSRQCLGYKSAKVLLTLVVPGQFFFVRLIWACHSGDQAFIEQTQNLPFLFLYLAAALVQVTILLHAAHSLVIWQWNRCLDPDTFSIPYLTAVGDLLGIVLLASAFYVHELIPDDFLSS